MLNTVYCRLCHLFSRLRRSLRRRKPSRTMSAVKIYNRTKSREEPAKGPRREASIRFNGQIVPPDHPAPAIRIATFNAAMFSMASAVPASGGGAPGRPPPAAELNTRGKPANDRPKSILKRRSCGKPKLRVSINLPDDEISAERRRSSSVASSGGVRAPPLSGAPRFPPDPRDGGRSVMDVLRDAGADIVALQNVKAVEEKGMRPLSDLAEGLGMEYVFAESWAPEYGNAVLSRWPIKRWRVQNIPDDADYRNVLKATIDVPEAGEVSVYCTHLDHFDESWRMKQVSKILQSSDGPHILVGGLNSLDERDYSAERWADIVKYYEGMGKPTPRAEVTKFLREKRYSDAKNFAGECESVVVVAKGQDVQGTCKYGTRVDYILASPDSPFEFVPRSYMVLSSKGTSDHHIVKVDVQIADRNGYCRSFKPKVVKMRKGAAAKGIWNTNI